jgi:hypothetical protein
MDGNALMGSVVPLVVSGALGAAAGLAIEYGVVKPLSKGNQDWAIPSTYALLGIVLGAYYRGMLPKIPGV